MSEGHDAISLNSATGLGSSSSTAADPVLPSPRPRASAATDEANSSPASESVGTSIARINVHLASSNRVLTLRVNAQTGMTVVEIKDGSTGRVLHEVPSRDLQHLAEILSAWADGKSILADVLA